METTQQPVEKRTFVLETHKMGELEARFAALNRRAKKLGLTPVSYKVVKFEPEERDGMTYIIHYDQYTIEVEGVFPKLPGYAFVGTLEHTEHGNIVRALPGNELGEEYRTLKPVCDHCKTKRARKDTYLVRFEDGSIKQVGHSCIKDFLGGQSPEQIAFMLQFDRVHEIPDGDGLEGRSYRSFQGYYPEEFMSYVVELVRQRGHFMSKTKAQELNAPDESNPDKRTVIPTSSEASFYLNLARDTSKAKRDIERLTIRPESTELAREVLTWGKLLLDRKGLSNFEYNLALVAQKSMYEPRDLGIAAAMYTAYQKAMGTLPEAKPRWEKPVSNSQYVGELGKRMDLGPLTLTKLLRFETDFGKMSILIFQDATENIFTWKTNTHTDWAVEGREYTVRATVKKHEVYRDVKQTVLARSDVNELPVQSAKGA